MSIDALIRDLIDALKENTDALKGRRPAQGHHSSQIEVPLMDATTHSSTATSSMTDAVCPVTAIAKPEAVTAPVVTAPVSLDTAMIAVSAMMRDKGRDAVVAILASFGAKKVSEVTDLAGFIAAVNAARLSI